MNYKRFFLYLLRWQASTPILALVVWLLAGSGYLAATIVANLLGGMIFFWVDRYIFTSDTLAESWEVKEGIICVDCGKLSRGYRIVRTRKYDRTDAKPEFRCEECSQKKADQMRKDGVI